MNKKIKILLAALGLVSLLAAGTATWIYLSAQNKVDEYAKVQAELKRQNTYLQEKLDSTQRDTRHWRERAESITAALDRLDKEHTILQKQYETLLKEKDSLAQENKELSEKMKRLNKLYYEEKERAEKSASDKFLASLLEEKAALEVEIGDLKDKIAAQRAQLEDVEKRASPSKEKVENLEKQIDALERKFEKAQRVSDILSNDLLKERKKATLLNESLVGTEEQLKKITQEKDKLSEQLVKMKQALEKRLAELNQTKKVLESAVEGAKEVSAVTETPSIQLPPIVVKAEGEKPSLAGKTDREEIREEVIEEEAEEIFGRIITVNDRHRFVVIDIGRDEGIKKGMSLDVYRRDEKIGRVEVIETRKNIAACDIKEMNVQRLKVSDTVRR